MTTASYPLGRPRPAFLRGGDCRARDLDQACNVFDQRHRFVETTHCQFNNGLVRITAGASGEAPSLILEGRRGRVVVGDVYDDVYSDTYDGSIATPEWFPLGTLTIDSPTVAAELVAVRPVRLDAIGDEVTVRLIAPLMADAFVTLRRGERMCRIQHGSTRPPFADVDRRVALSTSPAPAGIAFTGRVQEVSPDIAGLLRFVASTDAVTADAGAFSLTASSVIAARFGAGAGTYARRDRPVDLHRQLGDTSRTVVVVDEEEEEA